jgi:hypothetical protein
VSRVEFLIRLLQRLIEEAGAPAGGASPVSLQVSLIVQQIRREQPFTAHAEAAADRLLALSLNLELAVEEGGPVDSSRAAVREALEQFVERLGPTA